jgi:hypothetical protein
MHLALAMTSLGLYSAAGELTCKDAARNPKYKDNSTNH